MSVSQSDKPFGRAVIIGGSIAGLAAARVLADYFKEVSIIERDRLPETPSPRPGVPQSRQLHVLLMRGQRLFEQLFPGLQDELALAGAPAMDWMNDCLWFGLEQWAPRFPSQMLTRFCSRELLEWTIRRRLPMNARVRWLDGREAVGLVVDPSASRVTGVRLRGRSGPQAVGPDEELAGDLVVDASGRESRLPQWLQQLGYPRPLETVVNSFLGYASRFYHPPKHWHADWRAILLTATPPDSSRGAGIFPIEGGRWIVNVGAAQRDYPPTDEAGFLEFIKSLPVPTVYEAVRDAQPLTPIYGYRRTENRMRHYEHLPRWPENLVALGDTVCAFNPVYGQGMTVAAVGAVELGKLLGDRRQHGEASDLVGLGREFQKRLARVNALPWSMATSVDFIFPETEGKRPSALYAPISGYLYQVRLLTFRDPRVHLLFSEVVHLLKPPSALFHPQIAAKVVCELLTGRSRPPPSPRSRGHELAERASETGE